MTSTPKKQIRRRLDLASLLLMLVGITAGIFAIWLADSTNITALIVIPSVVATTVGASNITKVEARLE